MLDKLSKIDELFLDASLEVEKLPAEGDWESMRKKLFVKRSRRKFFIWFFIGFSAILIAASAIIWNSYDSNFSKTSLSPAKRIMFESQDTRIVQCDTVAKPTTIGYATIPEYFVQNNYANFIDTTRKVNHQNNNLPYKVQIGAFKNKPAGAYYLPIGNVSVEDKDGYHKYYAGEYSNIAEAQKRLNEVKALGFADAFIAAGDEHVYAGETQQNASYTADEQNKPVNSNTNTAALQTEQTKAKEDSTTKPVDQQKDSVVQKVDNSVAANTNDSIKNSPKTDPFKKYGIGLVCSYNINTFRVTENTSDGAALLNTSSPVLHGTNYFSYSLGMQFTYRFNERFTAETGMLYSQKRKLSALDLIADSVMHYSFEYTGKYFDLPVRARFYVINKPVKLFVSAGALFSSNFPVKNKGYFLLERLDTSIYTERVTLEPLSVGVSLQLGVGIDYVIQNKWRLYFTPNYNYSLNAVLKHSTYNNEPVKHYINGLSFSFGCYYDF